MEGFLWGFIFFIKRITYHFRSEERYLYATLFLVNIPAALAYYFVGIVKIMKLLLKPKLFSIIWRDIIYQ